MSIPESILAFGKQVHNRVHGLRFDYAADKCKCPACGGIGMAWRGAFFCDECEAVAVIETGAVYMPAVPGQTGPRW